MGLGVRSGLEEVVTAAVVTKMRKELGTEARTPAPHASPLPAARDCDTSTACS